MKRVIYSLFMAGLMAGGVNVYADSLQTISGVATGISPDGTKVVGQKETWGDAAYTSFLFTVANGETQWLTNGENYMGSHLDGGRFMAITNSGIIAGTIRNPEMRLEPGDDGGFKPGKDGEKRATYNFSDDEEGEAISSAAVWRNGKTYVLGCGPHSIDEFFDSTDGSEATGISEDGNLVFGHIRSSWMPLEACMWEYDAASDKYEYRRLPLPSNAMVSSMISNASTGFPAIGSISVESAYGGMMMPILWTSAENYVALQAPDMDGAYAVFANAISENGRYVAISVNGTHPRFYVYDTENGTYKEAALSSDSTEVSAYTINNDGNCVLKLTDNSWSSYTYFFDYASGALVTISSYLEDVMPDTNPGTRFSQTQFVATSGDGKHLLAASASFSMTSYVFNIDNPAVVIASAPAEVEVYHTSPDKIEIKFNGIEILPKGCELKGYKVYVKDKEIKTIDATDFGGTYYVETDGKVGSTHIATVTTLYTKGDEEKESAASSAVTTFVADRLSLINFYNFDDSVITDNGDIHWTQNTWSARQNYGVTGELINWYLSDSDFENRTPAVTVVAVPTEPWSSVFESHFMDATDAKDFYLDLRYQLRLINTAEQILNTDYLDVEVTTDGRTWTSVARVKASDVKPVTWNTLHVDLGKELAGKVFRMRLNAHGEGMGHLSWSVDDIAIGNSFDGRKPEGLRYALNDKGVKVMWKDAYDMYDVSHLDNSAILWDYNVGNEGKPMIGAIDLTEEQLKPFEGEYIRAISTFLYDDQSIAQEAPTTAEAIVFADGKEVARALFDSDFDTVDQAIAWLDTPVAVEKGKSYRVGVRILNYAKDQAPMYYQASAGTIPGVTDLYSEDDGKTWHNASASVVSDVNPNGYCIWPIRAYISADSEVTDEPSSVLYYDIFRDGEKINDNIIYEPRPWYQIAEPFQGIYTVQAHYAGGLISPMSDPLDLNGIDEVKEVSFTLGVTTGRGTVIITGDCEGAVLYNMSGRVVATTTTDTITGIPAGAYILQARTASGYETYKIVVK